MQYLGGKSKIRKQVNQWFFSSFARDIEAMNKIIDWQRKSLNYQSIYNAYLLGAINEDDFEAESDSYLIEPKNLKLEEVVDFIGRTERLLNFKPEIDQIAECLSVDFSLIQEAKKLLSCEHARVL